MVSQFHDSGGKMRFWCRLRPPNSKLNISTNSFCLIICWIGIHQRYINYIRTGDLLGRGFNLFTLFCTLLPRNTSMTHELPYMQWLPPMVNHWLQCLFIDKLIHTRSQSGLEEASATFKGLTLTDDFQTFHPTHQLTGHVKFTGHIFSPGT